MISSKATIKGTHNYSHRHPEMMFKDLGETGLLVSACGFGSYRVDFRIREHTDAMKYAISDGINLIDTSANYNDGGSETLIGNVLSELIEQNVIKREEVVLVSKGGYIQGKNLDNARRLKDSGSGFEEVVEYTETIWHSIHPGFLADQIENSRKRMNVECIDIYLLHNPEYFLDSPSAKELSLAELRQEYYKRIKKAFAFLETEVEKGRIGCYGISSNSFVYASDAPTFTSLEQCLKAASEILESNHFRVIEFPLNLYERGAVITKNQRDKTMTLLELAKESNLAALVNRPLNAISGNRLNRLADFEVNAEFTKLDESQIIAEISFLESLEDDFLKEYLELLNLSEENRSAVNYFLKAGQLLKENWKNFGTIESFGDLKKQFLIPRVNFALGVMMESGSLTPPMKHHLEKIAVQINRLMEIVESIYGVVANARSREIHSMISSILLPEEAGRINELPLSRKAILLINSLDEISCTLVGMRQTKYVDDIIETLRSEKIDGAMDVWKNFTSA